MHFLAVLCDILSARVRSRDPGFARRILGFDRRNRWPFPGSIVDSSGSFAGFSAEM